MRKIDTSGIVDPLKQQPFTGHSLTFLQDAIKELGFFHLFGGTVGSSYNFASNYAVWGVGVSGTTVSAGSILAGGEFYYFAGGSTSGFTNTGVFSVLEISAGAPYDPITYTDSSTGNVHLVRSVILQDLPDGSGVADLSSIVYVQNTISRTKYINIGAWDMQSTSLLNVAHGLSLPSIRNVSVFVYDDAGTVLRNLTYSEPTVNIPDGGFITGTTNVSLSRRTGGIFDSASFNDGSMNRGFITIQYVD